MNLTFLIVINLWNYLELMNPEDYMDYDDEDFIPKQKETFSDSLEDE